MCALPRPFPRVTHTPNVTGNTPTGFFFRVSRPGGAHAGNMGRIVASSRAVREGAWAGKMGRHVGTRATREALPAPGHGPVSLLTAWWAGVAGAVILVPSEAPEGGGRRGRRRRRGEGVCLSAVFRGGKFKSGRVTSREARSRKLSRSTYQKWPCYGQKIKIFNFPPRKTADKQAPPPKTTRRTTPGRPV